MKSKPYKFTPKDKKEVTALATFLLGVLEPGPIRAIEFTIEERKTEAVGIIKIKRQRESDDKKTDILTIKVKQKNNNL